MIVVLDACVLFPTVMREMLIGAAETGAFSPIWSARILEEWARAAAKLGPTGEAQARAEIALLKAAWPKAERAPSTGLERQLWLPDPADIHVLATAVDSSADAILTTNAKDFPRNILSDYNILRLDPDGFLISCWQTNPGTLEEVAKRVRDQANAMTGGPWTYRALLKKARLPRLGKALQGFDA